MSAMPSLATKSMRRSETPLSAISGLMQCSKRRARVVNDLLYHLIGELLKVERHFEAECLRRLQVNHQLELGRCLHWKLGRLGTPEDAIDIAARPPKQIDHVDPVRNQPAFGDHEPVRRDGRQFVLASQPDD